MAKVIYRGPIKDEPETVNLPVAGAYLPGILVTENGTTLTAASAATTAGDLLVLSNARYAGQSVDTAYVSGETGVAYRTRPGEVYNARLAAATYAVGDELTVGASGYLEAAAAGERVVAHFAGVAGAVTAGTLHDVRIANSYAAPA